MEQNPPPLDTDTLTWLCPQCGYTKARSVEMDLFGDPTCRQCGGRMRVADDSEPHPEPSDRLVDTMKWLEENFAPLLPVPDGEEAQEVPQSLIDQWLSDPRDLTFDQWLAKCEAQKPSQIPVADTPPDFSRTLEQLHLFGNLLREGGEG